MIKASINNLKTNLSKYKHDLETGINDSVLITKNGIVVAEMIRRKKPEGKIKFGIGKEIFNGQSFDPFEHDEEITKMFLDAIKNDDFA